MGKSNPKTDGTWITKCYGPKCRSCRPPSDSLPAGHAAVPNLEVATTGLLLKNKKPAGAIKGMAARQKEVHPTLQLHPTVKRPGQLLAATYMSGHNMCHLLHVTDRTSIYNFFVDTGTQVNTTLPTYSNRLHRQGSLTLSTINGSAIATYGQRSLTLNLGLRRTFHWIFIFAKVSKLLLGADFLHHFGLLVDIAHGKLVDTGSHLSIHGIVTEGTSPSPTITTTTNKSSHPYSQNFRTSPRFTTIKTTLSSTTLYTVQPVHHSPPEFDVSPQKNFKLLTMTHWS